jgi:hypothetical protein
MPEPSNDRDSLRVAQHLAERFASTAVERNRRGGTPKAERDLIRQSGLLALLFDVMGARATTFSAGLDRFWPT